MSTPLPNPTDSACLPVHALGHSLRALQAWLTELPEDVYADSSECSRSTIGQHLRHSLDHVQALLDGLETGCICYDRRLRRTSMEADRDAGVARIDALADRLVALADFAATDALDVVTIVDPTQPEQRFPSCLGRELAFVLSHAIHHNALIGVIAAELGHPMPATLSKAPATLAADADPPSCAR